MHLLFVHDPPPAAISHWMPGAYWHELTYWQSVFGHGGRLAAAGLAEIAAAVSESSMATPPATKVLRCDMMNPLA